MDQSFCKNILNDTIKFKVIDINDKVYDSDKNKIYMDDSIQTVIDKISMYCNKLNHIDIYVWYLDNDDNIKSLYFNYKIDINIFTNI